MVPLVRDRLVGELPPTELARGAVKTHDDKLIIVRGGHRLDFQPGIGLGQLRRGGDALRLDGRDHEDLIAIMRYLQTLPYVDKNAIGAMGVSHSGEMILKAAAEYDFAAGVCIEPATHEFLSVNTSPTAPRKGTEIQYNDIEVVRKNADKAAAMERIRRIKTPILIFGRDTDHLNGIFKLTNEWLREAGKDVTWYSFDHPVHGYVFIYPQPDGAYRPDPIQEKTFEIVMSYFDKRLKHSITQ